ncbi:sigma-54-dependent Fis family transcriptional regulator [Janthinobacterium sp. 1_2014MBL_MicDiv]|uniref:sigma-54-dependent Fis family transcriptional regulator n=1 Tax=Janthinobacterium sp. 1_2014MBL_MicDiv TaxID=1644131 RepID=UPI0008F52A3B|nr:GAF domain-containing protein [Janthinobacterium sp. 1_2014MBL_MicDiv]APA67823.1 Fis family transcriptional regulator [Janthinobacterium sp. 1_2014MBL_MicDiv]
MPYVRQTSHIERVRDLIAGRIVNPGADTARLASSYRRSLDEYRLDPASTTGPRILTAAELRAIQQSEEGFLRSTGHCLPRLHAMVREAGYCVILANARGVTIDYVVDTHQRKDFKKAGLYPGSCWSEDEEGTCGIASVLLDREAITVHKTDHFRAAFTGLTCSAAPIFSPHGELIGVLDASALTSPDARDSQRLVKQLVRQSATLIEDGFFIKSYAHCCILLAHRNRHFVEVQPEMLIAVDEHGDIVAANRCARDLIAGLDTLPRPVGEVLEVRAERLFDARAGHNLLSLRLAGGSAWLHARVRAPLRQGSLRTRARREAPATQDVVAHTALELAERTRIVNAMSAAKWRPLQAAAMLGVSRATLYRRIKQLKIVPPHRQ